MEAIPILHNPYFIYPGSPFKGYHNFKLYNSEIIRLVEYINNLISNPQHECLFHLCIGASFEEIADSEDYSATYNKFSQWRQLFPDHVESFIVEQKQPVRICIVSPNKTFEPEQFKEPLFIKYTNELFNWERVNNMSYISKLHNVTIDIFCTMFPHNDNERNNKIMNYIKRENLVNMISWVMDLEQTEYDINFITMFYKKMEMLFDAISEHNGIITCFSFAVFNENTEYNKFNEYEMFSELKNLFKITDNNRILCRWIFNFESQTMLCHMNKLFKNIIYVNGFEYLGKSKLESYIGFVRNNDKILLCNIKY